MILGPDYKLFLPIIVFILVILAVAFLLYFVSRWFLGHNKAFLLLGWFLSSCIAAGVMYVVVGFLLIFRALSDAPDPFPGYGKIIFISFATPQLLLMPLFYLLYRRDTTGGRL